MLAISTTAINPHEIQLWDLSDVRKPVRSDIPPIVANEFVISHDGKTLAVAADNTVDLWDISDIQHPVMTTSLPAVAQEQLTFSPDDHLLVSTARSLGAIFNEASTTKLHMWDVTNSHNTIEISTPKLPGAVKSLGFSPDGTILIVGGNTRGLAGGELEGEARLLDPNLDSLTKRLCDAVRNTLTPSQWQQYFPGTPYSPPCG